MSSHRRVSRTAMRVWMGVNGLVLLGLAGWIIMPSATAPAPEDRPAPAAGAAPSPGATPDQPPPIPTRDDILDTQGLWFGLSAPDVPWSSVQVDRLSESAGAAPTMIQTFVNWTQDYPAETVELSYQRGAVPVLSWEPWAGLAHGESQPDYALRKIVDGDFDSYARRFAQAVSDHGWPVAIRFAHEMNGFWYPWSEQNSGNQPGDFVEAWRYLHELFDEAGADNVIWIWSPNIIRAVRDVSLEALYPGDDYVDWIGMVGYAVEETTAAEVFGETRSVLRDITDKPLLITETGAEPGPHKVPWIEDLFSWLDRRSDVIGFIWFEYSIEQGGNSDWRFTARPESIEAFREGIAQSQLAPPPIAWPEEVSAQ